MRKPILLLCCCWLLVLQWPVQAAQTSAEDWFEIEVLLFKRNRPEPLDEYWPQDGERTLDGTSLSLLDPFARARRMPRTIDGSSIGNKVGDLYVLSTNQLQLIDAWRKLSDNALFDPLLHVGWRQHVDSASKAEPVHLFAGNNYGREFRVDGRVNDGSSELQSLWELDGLLRIHLQRYLYINADFLLRQPGVYSPPLVETVTHGADEIPSGEPGVAITSAAAEPPAELDSVPAGQAGQPFLLQYPMHQQRRVRSGELHYFDHPLFGMLIQIRRIE